MRGLKRIKRGFTLVEVVISVAILVALLIPIATITVTTIKTSASAEDKQKATIIGQQLLEELKANDDILLTSDTFELLNRQILAVERDLAGKITRIHPSGIGDTFSVTNDGVEYQVKLVMTRESSASYEAAVPTPIGTYNQSLFFYDRRKVNVVKDTTVDAVDTTTHTIPISTKLILNIDTNMNINLTDENNSYPAISKTHDGPVTTGGRILINLDKNYGENYTNDVVLKINSAYTLPIIIDIVKEKRTSENIIVDKGTPAGDIMINNNISTGVPETMGDLYRIEVSVSRTGTGNLFEDTITKNILFH